jgi:hypothetical protein
MLDSQALQQQQDEQILQAANDTGSASNTNFDSKKAA